METEIENDQALIISNSIELFKSAPEILKQNQGKTQQALIVGNSILEQWHNAFKIEDEDARMEALAAADERSNKYLVNCANALKNQKALRAAITQMMDNFKKMFTEAENQIDKSKADTVPSKIQNSRDTYAREAFKIQERKRIEAERVAAKAKEAVEIKYQLEANYKTQYNNYLLQRKTKLQSGFNAITLDMFEGLSGALKKLTFSFQFKYEGPYTSITVKYHSDDELKKFVDAIIIKAEPELEANFLAEMNLLREDLVEKLPSKKAELLEQKRMADEIEAERKRAKEAEERRQKAIAIANQEEKKRLEDIAKKERAEEAERAEQRRIQQEAAAAEQKRREDEEAARLVAEAEEAKRKSEMEAEIKKQGEQTMVLFEQEASLSETAPAPETRQGYEIIILHPVAYTQIFALWFENEGKNLPVDKIGNTKLEQMKTWAEKHAHKTGTKIESKFLKYEDSFKAVNRKVK